MGCQVTTAVAAGEPAREAEPCRQAGAQGEGLPKPGGDEGSARSPRPGPRHPGSWDATLETQQGRLCIDRGQHPVSPNTLEAAELLPDLEVGNGVEMWVPGLRHLHPQPPPAEGLHCNNTRPPGREDSSGNPHVCGRGMRWAGTQSKDPNHPTTGTSSLRI